METHCNITRSNWSDSYEDSGIDMYGTALHLVAFFAWTVILQRLLVLPMWDCLR